jgi:multicomponent Na+:H+ antiporter subunit G
VTAAVLLLLGAGFMLLAGVGLIRLPDLFLRLSATAKAATLGAALTAVGAAAHFGEPAIVGRVLAIVSFLFLTAPVAAHRIGRAGYRRGSRLYEGTICDEAKGCLPRDDDVEKLPSIESR